MAAYRFLTTWLIEAEREACWDVLQDVSSWPRWWQGVRSAVELDPGDAGRVGSVYRVEWRSRIPYPVVFDFRVEEVEVPTRMSGHATGVLEGEGEWRLFEQDGVTAVVYDWDVRTTRLWMNALAPVARRTFRANHDWVMARGGEGLARRLGARLLAND